MSDDRNYETTETSEISEAEHSSEKSFPETKVVVPDSDATKCETEKEENFEDFKTKIEILVELGSDKLRSFTLSDCYSTDRPGMHLEILPKIIFDSIEDETDLDEIDLPKPLYRLTVDCGTQASIECKTSEAQTSRSKKVNSWSQFEPRMYKEDEVLQNLENSSFISFKDIAEESILDSIAQNSIADSFFYDLSSLGYADTKLNNTDDLSLSISGSFSCSETNNEDKFISYIAWHPKYKDVFVAATVRSVPFEERTKCLLELNSDLTLFYMWSVKNQFFHKLTLEYFDDIQVLKFNASLPNLIVGGSLTGQLVLWDIQKELPLLEIVSKDSSSTMKQFLDAPTVRCCAVSSMDHCQKHGITDLQWIPKSFEISSRGNVKKNPFNASYQLVTCGLDGLLQFWDLKFGFIMKPGHPGPQRFLHLDGVWEPFHTIEIFAPESRKRKALTCFTLRTSFQFEDMEHFNSSSDNKSSERDSDEVTEEDVMSTEFYGGCDDGMILCGDFKLKKDEAGKFIVKHPDYYNSPHNSAVTILACSPFIPDTFLSAGGRCFAIWEHSIKEEPVLLRQRSSFITCGQWSPCRPAVFILGLSDGSVEVWDLLYNLYIPYISYFMSTSAILSSSIQRIAELEHIIIAGDAKGVVYSMSIPSELWSFLDKELENTKRFIETEASRITSDAQVAKKKSVEVETATKKAKTDTSELPEKEPTIEVKEEDILKENYEKFLKLQKRHLSALGLLKEDPIIEDIDPNISESHESLNHRSSSLVLSI